MFSRYKCVWTMLSVLGLACGCAPAESVDRASSGLDSAKRARCTALAAEFGEWGREFLAGRVEEPAAPLAQAIRESLQRPDVPEGDKMTMVFLSVFGACCPEVTARLESISYARGEDKPGLMVAGITVALASCDCESVDVANAKSLVYSIWNR
jgi:hypothetical protein